MTIRRPGRVSRFRGHGIFREVETMRSQDPIGTTEGKFPPESVAAPGPLTSSSQALSPLSREIRHPADTLPDRPDPASGRPPAQGADLKRRHRFPPFFFFLLPIVLSLTVVSLSSACFAPDIGTILRLPLAPGTAEAAEEFSLLSLAPEGEIRAPVPIRAVFSAPVIPASATGKTLDAGHLPLRFSPPLPGLGKWTDQRTFVYTPRRVPQATRWTVSVVPGIRDLKGRPLTGGQVFFFSTPALRFLSARQTDFTEGGQAVLDLRFSLPILPARLRGFLSARRDGKEVPLEIPPGPPSTRVLLKTPGGGPLSLILAAGLTSESGPLGIDREIRIRLSASLAMEVRESEATTDMEGGRIHVRTSSPVNFSKVRPFVRITPERTIRVEPTEEGFDLVGSFSPRDRVVLTLMKGLPSKGGTKLKADFVRAFIFPDREAGIRFASPGRILSPLNKRRLTLETVNVGQVDVTVYRLYENNLPFVLRDRPWLDDFPLDLTRLVKTQRYRTDGEPNRIVRRSLDLGKLVGEARGVFLVAVRDGEGQLWQETRTLVNLTDLGVVARTERSGALLWVNSIGKGTPISGAKVTLWSSSNQVVAEGRTDGDGLARIRRDAPFEPDLLPILATVTAKGDISYTRLDENLFDRSGLDLTGRPYPGGGLEALLFLPRGVYRPGETAVVKALVRDARMKPPKPFPVLFTAYAPDGREALRATVRLSDEGTGVFAVPLDDAVPTGEWRFRVQIPGEQEALGEVPLLVEDFAPPRLAIRPRANRARVTRSQGVTLSFDARWLFGAPASGLPYEVELAMAPRDFTPLGWGAFTFGDPARRMDPTSSALGQGTLSETGTGEVEWRGGAFAPPSQLDLAFRVGVMEEGGRWVYQTLVLPMDPYGLQIGIGKNRPEAAAGRTAKIPVAAVTPEGKPSALAKLRASFFKVIRTGLFVDEGGTLRWQEQEQLAPVGVGDVPLKAGRGDCVFLPKEGGEYLLRVEDSASGAAASTRLYVSGTFSDAAESGGAPSRITITLNKKRYRPGETVEATLSTPFPASVLFTVETDRVLQHRLLRTEGKSPVRFRFKADEGMSPNAWCTAWAIRPAGPEKSWTAHRAFGAVELPIDREDHRLSVELTGPKRVLPGEKLKVALHLKDPRGRGTPGEVALALVDEGILSLTGYEIPDPFGFFTARRAQSVPGYDLYDDLIPVEPAAAPPLHPAGDGAAELAMKRSLSPVSVRRFKPLALFLPTVRTDASGNAEATFVLPDFTGSAKLVAVACAADRFGSSESTVRIASNLVLEPALPRAVAPGDRFSAPILLANTTAKDMKVRLSISASGPLAASLNRDILVKAGDNVTLPVPYRAGPSAGKATVKYEALWPGGRDRRTLDLPVRPASPPIRRTGAGTLEAGKSVPVLLPGGWFPGTGQATIAASGTPRIRLADAARFLLSYPYGCLEQTISSGWPPLVQPDLVRGIDPKLAPAGAMATLVKEKIRRIRSLQQFDGGFSSWPGETGSNRWGSVYGAHFLTEAKRRLPGSVPEILSEPTLRYLRTLMTASPETTNEGEVRDLATAKAYGAYVLALNGEPPLGWMEHLRDRIGDLYPSGRSLLAAAYATAGQRTEARKLLPASAPSTLPPRSGATLESPLRDRALRLLAWLKVDPRGAEAGREASALLSALRSRPDPTTQESAFALYALGDWMAANPTPPGRTSIRLADASGRTLGTASGDRELSVSVATGSRVTLSAGGGQGMYAWTAEGIPLAPVGNLDQGLALRWALKDRKGHPISLDRPIPRGTSLVGELTLKPLADAPENLVLVWPTAGGLEIENPRLTSPLPGEKSIPTSEGVRPELRDDRLVLFVNRLERTLVWRFPLRAVTAGHFVLPAASAAGMYDPGLRSTRKGGIIEIR
jgi:uncharacterized protein YfaS (alpha-2-macroglobulin family)